MCLPLKSTILLSMLFFRLLSYMLFYKVCKILLSEMYINLTGTKASYESKDSLTVVQLLQSMTWHKVTSDSSRQKFDIHIFKFFCSELFTDLITSYSMMSLNLNQHVKCSSIVSAHSVQIENRISINQHKFH
jgi:hypothetical protein